MDASDSGWGEPPPSTTKFGESGPRKRQAGTSMSGCSPSDPTHSSSQGLGPSCKDRQHSDCSMDKSPGLQHEQETELSGNTSAVSVFSTLVVDQGKSYPRPSEHLGRCSLQGSSDSLRVGSLSGVLQSSASSKSGASRWTYSRTRGTHVFQCSDIRFATPVQQFTMPWQRTGTGGRQFTSFRLPPSSRCACESFTNSMATAFSWLQAHQPLPGGQNSSQ